jgi:hypothetical protein
MEKCPECGSTEIINDLTVFAGEAPSGQKIIYVSMQEPPPEKQPFIWSPKSVSSGFHASICGTCGLTRFYASLNRELLEAQQKGYKGLKASKVVIIPQP